MPAYFPVQGASRLPNAIDVAGVFDSAEERDTHIHQVVANFQAHNHDGAGHGLLISGIPTVVNVKDVAYGAKGDGVTDDTIAIQAANDAVVTAGGGILFFPRGTYIVSGLLFDTLVTYQGAGKSATILQLKAGVHQAILKSRNFDTLTGTASKSGVYSFAIRDMTLFGDKTNNLLDTIPLLQIYGFSYLLDNLIVYFGRGGGIWSEWATAADAPPPGTGASGPALSACHWNNVLVHDCDVQTGGTPTDLIHFLGPHDSAWNHVDAANSANLGAGAYIGANAPGLEAVNCHMQTTVLDAWKLDGLAFLSNCYGEGGSHSQLFINASDTEVTGGIFNSGSVAPASATGIFLGGSVAVTNCKIDTKVINCLVGAINFNNDGGSNHVALNITQASGTGYIGAPSGTNELALLVNGGAGGQLWQVPSTVIMSAGTAQIVPTPNGFHVRNNANNADNFSVTDGGNFKTRGGVEIASGPLQIDANTGQIIPGATSLSLRNNANNADNVLVADAGNVSIRGNLGINGVAAIAKPTVTGAKGGNAALASLLTALANYGLITDSTT